MFTLKGCFDGDGELVGPGGSVGSWPNARLRQMTRIRYFSCLIFSLGSAFCDGKLRFVCGVFNITFSGLFTNLKAV